MNKLELAYLKPFPVASGSPFHFRVFGATDERPAAALHPVYVFGRGDETLLVAGHRRMEYAREHGEERIAALICPADTTADELVALSLEEASTLSGIEKIVAIRKTLSYAAPAGIDTIPEPLLTVYGAALGRPVSSGFVMRLLNLLGDNDEALRDMHRLGLTVAHLIPMLDLQPRERRTVCHLYHQTPMSVGEFRKLSRLILFARGRKTLDLDEWAQRQLASGTKNAAEVTASLSRTIYPDLHGRAATIQGILSEAKLPPDLRISPPENLEGDSYSCYFRFSRAADLRRHVEYLQQRLQAGMFDRLLDTLNDEASGKE